VSDLGAPDGLVLTSGDHPDGNLSSQYGQPIFSPDGAQIAFLRQNWRQTGVRAATLWVIPSDGSRDPRRLAGAPGIGRIIWHPTSRFVAFLSWDPENMRRTISVVSLDTGKVHEVLDLSDTPDEVRLNHWSPDGRWVGFSQLQGTMEYWMVDDPLAEAVGEP
jgi:Tol biopolymer transport system component